MHFTGSHNMQLTHCKAQGATVSLTNNMHRSQIIHANTLGALSSARRQPTESTFLRTIIIRKVCGFRHTSQQAIPSENQVVKSSNFGESGV